MLVQHPDPNVQVIIMTHEGPFGSATAKEVMFEQGGTINWEGSPRLRELLIENKSRIICHIHGHTHDGAFTVNIGSPDKPMTVINPGSLTQSEFGELKLRVSPQGHWQISELIKLYL